MSAMRMGRRDFLRARVAPRIVGAGEVDAAGSGPSGSPAEARTPARIPEVAPFLRRARAVADMPKRPLLARIDRFACLASTGQVCTTCVEHCPVTGALRLDGLVPSVEPDVCTGCGACEPVCPAPAGAIRVLPVLETRTR